MVVGISVRVEAIETDISELANKSTAAKRDVRVMSSSICDSYWR